MIQPVIIVSGLPRSGTSLMMQMLAAGGIDICIDNRREPDNDNPKGYYEFEKVKELQKDSVWVHTMRGKAMKVISFLLYYLPVSLQYKVIFMQRDLQEILLSQKKMLDRSGQRTHTLKDEVLAQKFETHLQKITKWITTQKNIECLYVSYNAILEDPLPYIHDIQTFLQRPIDVEGMASVVDSSLYRNRQK